jgi:hypothetical protein
MAWSRPTHAGARLRPPIGVSSLTFQAHLPRRPHPPTAPAPNVRSPDRYLWTMLLARLLESLPLTCPNCGADLRIFAFVTDAALMDSLPHRRTAMSASDPPPSDRPPGTIRRNRCGTGSFSVSPNPTSSLTNAPSGSRRLPQPGGGAARVLRLYAAPQTRIQRLARPATGAVVRSLRAPLAR